MDNLPRWQVDEALDANGHSTIRPYDGTPTGDIDSQPIATVYKREDAFAIVQANKIIPVPIGPARRFVLDLNSDARITIITDGNGQATIASNLKDDKRHSCYNAAIDALEATILALACAGYDLKVMEEVFITALDAILNKID